jgi:predicted  nucleic acid-binding Zn-ribbon protein
MKDGLTIEASLGRLDAAIGRLEAAVENRLTGERQLGALEEELQRLGEDRSRLAQVLDRAEAKSARLEETNREVSRRLVAAMEAIRAVLERHDG